MTRSRTSLVVLVSCVAALLALGLVMLYSASMVQDGARYVEERGVGEDAIEAICRKR